MTNKIIHPQEIAIWYIFPSIRRELSIAMKKQGIEQKKIGKLLGVTSAAISQYSNKKRANGINFNSSVQKLILQASKRIVAGEKSVLFEMQHILKKSEVQEIICQIHKKKSKISGECNLCIN
ncbi:MAG: hypothetical protein AABX66_03735 [Nanoarchaeota archaeon]|mgnify:CR=1 FL=1